MTESIPTQMLLETVAAEIEAFAAASGWDAPAMLFALVPTSVLAADPEAAALLGTTQGEPISPDSLTPIAQDELPEGPLDEALAQIGWPAEVVGCALSQQIVMLPPSAEQDLPDDLTSSAVAEHPDRREARLVVAVLSNGSCAAILRLRGLAEAADELLTGQDLAPNLAAALLATLHD